MLRKSALAFTVVAGLSLTGCYFCPFINTDV